MEQSFSADLLPAKVNQKIGTVGFLALFAWSVIIVVITPTRCFLWAAGLCLLLAAWVYPSSFRQLMRIRWLLIILLLSLPPVFLIGEADRSWLGITYSTEGLLAGEQIAVRIVVILLAIDGLTAHVDIISVAGLLERVGLRGLGFSIGVALNLLPILRQSAQNAWRSLSMRGGLRCKRWRGLRLVFITVAAGAVARSEEIALAAEARAFKPERARSLPVKAGQWDGVILVLVPIVWLILLLLP